MRVLRARAFFVLAAVPAVAFGWLVAQAPIIVPGGSLTQSTPWIPTLGVDLAYRIGTLQWVLALLVTGVGALVLFYCRWYFSGADIPARTGGLLVAFAGAMLGLVTADDLILLYVFWELTTVFSYLLVGHNPTRGANRRAALTALMVTTFGGLAMLIGIVMIGVTAGTFSLSAVMAEPALLGTGTVAVVAILLLLVGALTKSAQVPFHFWLPGAMAAPTPVSAYLHAAAMVKAGVYLVALLAPVFADLPGWRPVVLTLGAVTMIIGAWRALRQYDIKLLLAYGTVSQLGFLMAMCGLGTRSAMLAGVAMIISHALFKAALFLVVGIVDRSTGTRDIRKLSRGGEAAAAGGRCGRGGRRVDGGGASADRLHGQGGGVRVAGLPAARRRRDRHPPAAGVPADGRAGRGVRPHRRVHAALPLGRVRHQARGAPDRGHPRAVRLRARPGASWRRPPWSAASSARR